MSRDRTVQDEKQLLLTLGQLLNRRKQNSKIAFLLTPHNGSRMFARRGEISAVARTPNLDEPFRTAADRTDVLFQSWTRASRFPLTA
jgi:hypothetical protein